MILQGTVCRTYISLTAQRQRRRGGVAIWRDLNQVQHTSSSSWFSDVYCMNAIFDSF